MKALILEGVRQLRLGDWPEPVCGATDVLLRPIAAGICAGDMQHYLGRNPYTKYPLIGGHEVCGTVVETGTAVTRVVRGDLVVIEPVVGCGHCYSCRHGKPNCCVNFCLIGLHRPGGFAELCVAPAANVHRVPAGLDPLTASFAEPLTIGIQACRRGEVAADDTCLILGAGPIGLAILEVARARGARVIVSDLNAARLAFARELGAETISADARLAANVASRTNGDGADVVIEAAGTAATIEAAVDLVAPGGRVVIVGLAKEKVALDGFVFTRKEVNILGSRNSVGAFPEALALLASGSIRYPRVATQIPMWEGASTFAQLDANPAALHKAVLMLA
ncbi:MAG: alcohol dehydrogenase catalytic domain-containing protein [Verrucomicrobia bacterium]|nr:alcohol dehydrogenase catalytic domain-containing protein [Verrucomicrobiota bacterium]